MEGFIRVRCCYCNSLERVKVTFKDYRSPFEDTQHTCSKCAQTMLVTDPHIYDEEGYVTNG